MRTFSRSSLSHRWGKDALTRSSPWLTSLLLLWLLSIFTATSLQYYYGIVPQVGEHYLSVASVGCLILIQTGLPVFSHSELSDLFLPISHTCAHAQTHTHTNTGHPIHRCLRLPVPTSCVPRPGRTVSSSSSMCTAVTQHLPSHEAGRLCNLASNDASKMITEKRVWLDRRVPHSHSDKSRCASFCVYALINTC